MFKLVIENAEGQLYTREYEDTYKLQQMFDKIVRSKVQDIRYRTEYDELVPSHILRETALRLEIRAQYREMEDQEFQARYDVDIKHSMKSKIVITEQKRREKMNKKKVTTVEEAFIKKINKEFKEAFNNDDIPDPINNYIQVDLEPESITCGLTKKNCPSHPYTDCNVCELTQPIKLYFREIKIIDTKVYGKEHIKEFANKIEYQTWYKKHIKHETVTKKESYTANNGTRIIGFQAERKVGK